MNICSETCAHTSRESRSCWRGSRSTQDVAGLLESTPVMVSLTVLLRSLQNPRGEPKDFWNQDAEETGWIPFKTSLGPLALPLAAPDIRRIEWWAVLAL